MLKSSARSAIRLRGVRHNNLKNFDLNLPLNQLIVITGLSGSGKSSLAFDTLFAEGQRRYIETFSPYARQFFDRMDKPQADSIEGIPPAIAIEQRNSVKTTRSTVGTMTEICDYMKMLWPHISQLHCRQCGQPVRKDSPRMIWIAVSGMGNGEAAAGPPRRSNGTERNEVAEVLVTFDLPLTEKLSLKDSLALVSKQGYQRLLVDGQILRLDEAGPALGRHPSASLTIIQDRLKPGPAARSRFIEACEQAYHFGKGKLAIREIQPPSSVLPPRLFSNRLHCATCDIEYHEPSPALFSFNHPVGACPACRGFGRIISIDYDRALPDRSKALEECVVKPWQTGLGAECQADLMRMCRRHGVPTDVPFEKLPKKWQDFVVEGEPGYGKDPALEWPRAWYGIKGYFRWLESKSYKMHVRVLLSRYRAYTPCPDCQGQRFQPETLLYLVIRNNNGSATRMTLADFYQLPIRDAAAFVNELAAGRRAQPNDPLGLILGEVQSRLGYLKEVGLGYLTLDRPTRSLSGGETERVSLTTCLGTRLVNTLFVLDEPRVGLHPRDTERLVRILQQLRQAGNTVIVVEHEASVMRAADQIVDLGPGHGATGGQVVFQGTYEEILKSKASLTGQYLSRRKQIEIPKRRPVRFEEGRGEGQVHGEPPGSRNLQWHHEPHAVVFPLSSSGGEGRGEEALPPPSRPVHGQGDLNSSASSKSDRRSSPTPKALCLNEAPAPYRTGLSQLPAEAGRRTIAGATEASRQDFASPHFLVLAHATRHNLQDLTVTIPLARFVCVTGVSGSGKTTLVREVLLPTLAARLKSESRETKASDRLAVEEKDDNDKNGEPEQAVSPRSSTLVTGSERLGRVILVDQSILGKTPRSNPAVYIGAFDEIREFYAQSDPAKQRGLNASAFSFNSAQGQCERCRGAGFEKIEMQFLSDVFIRCPDCNGRRYRAHILEVKIPSRTIGNGNQEPRQTFHAPRSSARRSEAETATLLGASKRSEDGHAPRSFSIADLLEATVDEAIDFLAGFADSRPARRAVGSLKLLQEVGLGYLKLGQPINTLSGGESQRLKLVRELAEVDQTPSGSSPESAGPPGRSAPSKPFRPTLFLFDEPTTGLHFDDIRVLLKVFQRLVDAGHSVVVIEHNLEVIKCADWVIDLGPDAGDQGGRVVAEGSPEEIAQCPVSHTGRALEADTRVP